MNPANSRAKELGLLIIVGGPGGSGSSTISRVLAHKWQLNHVYAGGLIRNMAPASDNKSVTKYLDSLQKKQDSSIDQLVDKKLISFSQMPQMLIESKIFAALATRKRIPCTLKIWITCNWESRINRAMMKEKKIKLYQKAEATDPIYQEYERDLKTRYENDVIRFKELYDVDYSNPQKYNDIVLDTTGLTITESIKTLHRKIRELPDIRKKLPEKYLNSV